ncbi:MAG: hypothetical protein AB7I38_11955 [Dehalococcoidia bacterium]
MSIPTPLTNLLSDRTALLGSTAAALAGLPPHIIACYILGRLILPVLLIAYAAHGATPTQRIALVHAYLLNQPNPDHRVHNSHPWRKR